MKKIKKAEKREVNRRDRVEKIIYLGVFFEKNGEGGQWREFWSFQLQLTLAIYLDHLTIISPLKIPISLQMPRTLFFIKTHKNPSQKTDIF